MVHTGNKELLDAIMYTTPRVKVYEAIYKGMVLSTALGDYLFDAAMLGTKEADFREWVRKQGVRRAISSRELLHNLFTRKVVKYDS